MYVAGMALNDAFDARVDEEIRPERPISSGRISRGAAFAYGATCLALGLATLALLGRATLAWGGALAVCIVLYDLLHHRLAVSVVLMGACRGLVYPLAASAVSPPPDWIGAAWFSVALAVYVIAFTIIARGEAGEEAGRRPWLSLGLPVIVLAPAGIARPESWLWPIAGGLVLVAWLTSATQYVFQRRTRHAVLTWLSGICLVDTFYLTLLEEPGAALIALGCFGLTAVGHRYILGT
jgi:4-hydroxybenzoate polyprenyltransferase